MITSSASTAALTQAEAIAKARQYLETSNQTTRAQLAAELNTYAGDIDAVIAALKPVAPTAVQYGYSGQQRFTVPELQPQYWADQLYYYVPSSYNPSQPTGLFIGLHGGGAGTSREAARGIVDPNSGYAAYGYTLYIPNSPYIAVGPSAPWSDTNNLRWQMAGAEQYIAAVIRESQTRFNIDPNRIVISGFSMGGIGVYAMGLRMADRFAAVQPIGGMWEKAFWRSGLGTPFHILHGTYDATRPGDPVFPYRPRYTDIGFARLAQRLLNIDHLMTQIYEEHPWGHTSGHTLEVGGALPEVQRFFSWMTQQTRNPYQARVVVATPADGAVSSPHNRWVSINATRSGNILFDFTYQGTTGDPDSWFNWKLLHRKQAFPGAVVDATYEGNNTFRVSTRNVTSCSLWIHPSMGVNFANPITIKLNGQSVTRSIAQSLVTALNSVLRRNYDWGLIYHAEVVLNPVESIPAVAFAASGSNVDENTAQTGVTVALTNSSSSTITVEYQVTGGSATRDQDYALADGTLTFAPGETSKQIAIAILDDATPEGDETIQLSIGNPTNAYLGPEITHIKTIVGAQSGNGFTAYNDFAWTNGQPNANVTTLTRLQSGNLLNHQDGSSTGVVLSVDNGGAGPIFLNRASFEGHPGAGTDAYTVFSGKVDAHGYLESGTKDLTLTLSGLSPSTRYEVVLYGSAGVSTYSGRKSAITISGATSFENRSTPGADFPGVAYPTTTIATGYNSYDGHVARFDNVDPGPDGQVTITVSHHYRSKFYINALALRRVANEAPVPAQMTSPTPGSTLTSSTATFAWNSGAGVSQYRLSVGSTAGGSQYYDQVAGTNLSATVNGLPTNGSTLHVRLWSMIDASWAYNDYSYIATTATVSPTPAHMISPTPGSALTSSSADFVWNTGTGVSQYRLSVGSTAGGIQFFDQDVGTNLSATVSGLPTNGSTVYVRLHSKIDANWFFNDYSYTAASAGVAAQITSPTPGSTLTSSTTTFAWNTGTGVSQYRLSVGSTAGGIQFFDQDLGTSMSATVSSLPTNGSTVYVRLWSKMGANWVYNDYSYIAMTVTSPAPALMTSPTPGSTLTSSSANFVWNTGTGVSQYWLYTGTTQGGRQIYDQDRGTNLSTTVAGLPTNGSTIYVRLWSRIGSNWPYADYIYMATTAGGSAPAQMTTPTPGSTFTSSTVAFSWNTGAGVSQYWVYVGTTQGGNQLYDQNRGTNLSATVSGLPTNGSTIHVRLWSKIGSNWPFVDYTYKAKPTP